FRFWLTPLAPDCSSSRGPFVLFIAVLSFLSSARPRAPLRSLGPPPSSARGWCAPTGALRPFCGRSRCSYRGGCYPPSLATFLRSGLVRIIERHDVFGADPQGLGDGQLAG